MKESLHSEVKVSYLSPEELMKYRIGAKCDLENNPNSRRNWNWNSKKDFESEK